MRRSVSGSEDYTDPCSTPLLQDWLGDDQAKRQRREVHLPTGRFGEAIEQAQAVLFLASDESSFVNGTDFIVDGGMTRVRKRLSYESSDANAIEGIRHSGRPAYAATGQLRLAGFLR